MRLADSDWPYFGLQSDMRERLREARSAGRPVVLATLVHLEGSAPRPVGTQMVFDGEAAWGFFTGGCIESDIANHAAATLADGEPRLLIYGNGSPWMDIRLPCGSRMDIFVERIPPDDVAIGAILEAMDERHVVRLESDGRTRTACVTGAADLAAFDRAGGRLAVDYVPPWQLLLFGGDPVSLALARLAQPAGFAVILMRPAGPAAPAALGPVDYRTGPLEDELARLQIDRWTAIALATHDDAFDHDVLRQVLPSAAAYVGVLGAASRVPDRKARLLGDGVPMAALDRLRAPMGVARCGKTPWDVALSVMTDVLACREQAAR